MFHICQEDNRQDAFLCPVGTVFNQIRFICDWWFNFKCEDTPTFYHLNNDFHTPALSTTMRDTMNKIRSIQSKKDMNMIISLARSHKMSLQNKMDNDSVYKVRNSMNHTSGVYERYNRLDDIPFEYKMQNRIDDTSIPKLRDTIDDSSSVYRKRNRKGNISIRKMRQRIQKAIANRSMPPKIRNLFMLGMRMDKFGQIKSKNIFQNATDNAVTTSTLSIDRSHIDNDIIKAMSSTGYMDVSVSETATTINTTTADYNFNNFSTVMNDPSPSEYTTEHFEDNTFSTLDDPLRTFLNLSGLEMFVNGSIITTVKLNHIGVLDTDAVTDDSNLNLPDNEGNALDKDYNIFIKLSNASKNILNKTENNNKESIQDNIKIKREHSNNQSIYKDLHTQAITTPPEKETGVHSENVTISSSIPFTEVKETPATTKTPFNHENNFIIGNDTHISVSVTIRSKSGRSRLHWKRLPGIKTIRKILLKNTQEKFNLAENSMNETVYRRRKPEIPKSRIMWIPTKKDTLSRTDWRSFLESRAYNTIAKVDMKPVQNISQKATVENNVLQVINITQISVDNKLRSDEINAEYLTNETIANDKFILDPNITNALEYTEAEFSLSNVTGLSSPSTGNGISLSEMKPENKTEVYSNLLIDRNKEPEKNCTTICIKLLKSLNRNFSAEDATNTSFNKNSENLTPLESLETSRNSTFGRKSVLGASSSEQWMVKYDPGPNCDENTDNDKILIKGWSVIIDAGSVTKEKTVKRRGCTNASNNDQIVIMSSFNPYSNEGDSHVLFNSEAPHVAQNSHINVGSMDQRYWINLVKNWLKNSQSAMKQRGYDAQKKRNKGKSADFKWISDDFSVSDNDNENPYATRNEYFSARTKPQLFQNENGRQNPYLNTLTSRNVETGTKQNLVFENMNSERNTRDRRRSRFALQNFKQDLAADLQTETSDWFQATQRKNWSIDGAKGRDSSAERKRDWASETRTTDGENPQKSSRRGFSPSSRSNKNYSSSSSGNTKGILDVKAQTGLNSKARHDVHSTLDEDYDDWSMKRSNTNSDWSGSYPEDKWRKNLNKRDWSEEDQNDEDEWQSKSEPKRKDLPPDIKSIDWSSNRDRKDYGSNNEPKRKDWSKSGTKGIDWSSNSQENRHNENLGGKSQSRLWQPDSDRSDSLWKNEGFRNSQDEFGDSFNTQDNERRTRASNSKRDSKGRSLSDDWNWSSNKGHGDNIWPIENTRQRPPYNSGNEQRRQHDDNEEEEDDWLNTKSKRGQDWPAMKSRDISWPADKTRMRMQNNWASSKQKGKANIPSTKSRDSNFQFSDDRRRKTDWPSNKPDRWNTETDSFWKQDDDWLSTQKVNKGSTSRNNKNWDPNNNSRDKKGQGKNNPRDSNSWSRDNQQKKQKPTTDKSDWPSRCPDDGSDWTMDSRRGRNKGNTPPASDKGSWSSSNNPAWKQDTKPDDIWSIKSSQYKGNTSPRKSNRKNTKSDSELKRSNIPMKGQKSWNSDDQSDWADEDVGLDDYSWNRPSQKGSENGFTRNKMSSPSWKSEDQDWPPGLNKGQDAPWNSRETKQDSFGGSSSSDYSWTSRRKMIPDWSSESDFSQDRTSLTKGSNREERTRGRPGSWNKDSRDVSWPSKSGPDSKRPRLDDNSPKPKTKNDRNSWQSPKGDTRMTQTPSNTKGDPRNMPKIPWSDDNNSQKNSSNNKGDSGMKKIVWSVQISNDGKTGNGWVPITLRPNLKGRENKSRSDTNNKGGTSMSGDWPLKGMINDDWNKETPQYDMKGSISMNDDWSIENMKDEDWKTETAQNNETPSAYKLEIPTETNEFTSHMPQSSFSHLFYIPATNSRYKRDYSRNMDKGIVTSNPFNRPYKIIKSGEILNDASKNNNFFVAKADILVEDRRISQKNENSIKFGLKRRSNQLIFETPSQNTRSSNNHSSPTNKGNRSYNTVAKGIYRNWDEVPKESTVRERWSSPFYSANFSASGWIPVTTLKPSNFHSLSELFSQNSKNLTSKNNIRRSDALDINANIHNFFNPVITINTSQELHSNSTPKTFDVYLPEKNLQNDVNKTVSRNQDNGTEMKVGNETLRILSFSNIMKQFENEETLSKSQPEDSQEIKWNVPITNDPKKYSLKLIIPSKENTDNASNSLSFSLNENGTKQAWILTGEENIERNPISAENFSISDSQRNLYEKTTEKYKIIIGNRTIHSNPNEKDSNLTLNVPINKTTQSNDDTFRLKFRNWSGDSEWKPVIRSISKVVSFNRTRSKTDKSTVNK